MSRPVQLIWQAEAALGEGPLWLPDEQALWFVDIKRGNLHGHVPATGKCETHPVGGMPSFVVACEDGGLLVGSRHGLFRWTGGPLDAQFIPIPQPAYNRTNDGTVDGMGRLWFGTMDDAELRETGTIHCLNRGVLLDMPVSAIVTNGPAVSADAQTLYHVDSVRRTIWKHAIGKGPSLGDGEVFVQLAEADGYPDGIVLDSEDCLWVALWDGWAVRRYAPDGRPLLQVDMPCARVTKIAFGGSDLRTAFVTSARVGLDEAALALQPLAGSLFSFEVEAPGRALPPVRLGR